MPDRLLLILAPRKYKLHLEEKQVHLKLLALSLIRSTKTDLNPESSSSLHIDRLHFIQYVCKIIFATLMLVTQLDDRFLLKSATKLYFVTNIEKFY